MGVGFVCMTNQRMRASRAHAAAMSPSAADCAGALTVRGPAADGGRVLSADHAPQTPQAPSEDVSAATRPSIVLARAGRQRPRRGPRASTPSRPQLLRRARCAPCSPPEYRATVVCLRVGEPTVRLVPSTDGLDLTC